MDFNLLSTTQGHLRCQPRDSRQGEDIRHRRPPFGGGGGGGGGGERKGYKLMTIQLPGLAQWTILNDIDHVGFNQFHWSTSIQHAVSFTGLPLFTLQSVSLVCLCLPSNQFHWSAPIQHAVSFTGLPPFNAQSVSLVYLHSTRNQFHWSTSIQYATSFTGLPPFNRLPPFKTQFQWSTSIQHADSFTGLPPFNTQPVSLVYLHSIRNQFHWSTSIQSSPSIQNAVSVVYLHSTRSFTGLPPFNTQPVSLVYLRLASSQFPTYREDVRGGDVSNVPHLCTNDHLRRYNVRVEHLTLRVKHLA